MSLHAGHLWILREAVNQIDNYSVLDCLQNLLGAADQSPGNAPASDLQWLTSTTVLPDLLSKYAYLHQAHTAPVCPGLETQQSRWLCLQCLSALPCACI